jgi:hypothetical protein
MGALLRLGGRAALGAAMAATLALGFARAGGAVVLDDPAPPASSVSIGNATGPVNEGDNATFPVTVDPAASADFTVTFTTSEGLQGSFDVHAGDVGESVPVPTAENTAPEDDRQFTVTLDAPADPSVAVLGTATGTGTIVDDDWQFGDITMTPDPPSVPESGKTIDFQVSLNAAAPANHVIKVDYTVSDGSAHNGRDYTVTKPNSSPTGTIVLSPGQTAADVQITSRDDQVYDPDRQFIVKFSNPQGASFAPDGDEQVAATITNVDKPPLIGIENCTGSSVNGGDVATFILELGGSPPPTSVPASVDFTTVRDTATSGDLDVASGTATINPGSREFDVHVQTHAAGPAGDRTFHVQLSNPQNVRLNNTSGSCTVHQTAGGGGGGGGNQPTVTITNPMPVNEPASGSTPVSVNLTLNAPTPLPTTPQPVDVHWQTVDGTAKAGADYTAASGDITWPAGQYGPNPTPVTVTVNANPANTSPVTFSVAFTSADATFGSGGTATITIVPPGSTVPLLTIANASVKKHGGSVPVNVSLTPAATGVVTVDWTTADGSGSNAAVAGKNYTAGHGTLTFQAGETAKTISIGIIANNAVEPDRNFTITLSNATGGATIATGTATVTILNDVTPVVQPPVITPKPLQKPKPLPAQQPPSNTSTHFVLVQMQTGTSKVDQKGRAVFKITCPTVAVGACKGTAIFEVRVKQKVGKAKTKAKKTVLVTVRVANGSYSVARGHSGTFTAKLTTAGMKLLRTYKRMQVKATLTSKDAAGAKGVTAWLVSLQAPPPLRTALHKTTKPKTKTKTH